MFRKYGVVGLFVTMELKGKKIKTIDEALKELTEKDKEDIIKIQRGILEEYGIDVNKEIIKRQKEKEKVAISEVKTCSFFNISRSSYYYKKVINVVRNAEYESKKKLVYNTFVDTGEYMGANKLTKIIKRNSHTKISNNSVQFFMHLLNLKPHAYTRKRKDPKSTNKGFSNVIKRKFKSLAPNEVYTTDITYIHSNFAKEGFFYLNFYVDCFNNGIFGITLSEHPDTKLVMRSTKSLIFKTGTILHQDHGAQYTSHEYMNFIKNNKLVGSMSRIGNSLDNRPSEYANGRIKLECINKLKPDERTQSNILSKLEKYIFHYNNHRIQSCLGDKTPVQYRMDYVNSLFLCYNLDKDYPVS
jgi:transposase InsO family protein